MSFLYSNSGHCLLRQFIVLSFCILIFPQTICVFLLVLVLVKSPVPWPGIQRDDRQRCLKAVREGASGTEPLPWIADGQEKLPRFARISHGFIFVVNDLSDVVTTYSCPSFVAPVSIHLFAQFPRIEVSQRRRDRLNQFRRTYHQVCMPVGGKSQKLR